MPPRASIIVLNYNGFRYIDTCLEALLAQELEGGFEVLVVDNGSEDGSPEYIRERWPQVRVIEAGANLGFAGGNNLGLRQTRGHHVVLLNNDTRVRPGWLRALVEAGEADSGVAAVTSKLVYMSRPGVIQNAGSLVLTDGSGGDRGTDEPDQGQYERQEEVFAACGCAVLFNRSALEDVGPLDDTFFCYYEDTDLSWRMRLRGWRILYEPKAVVEHVHTGTSRERSPLFIFHVDRNRLFMIIKNAPFWFVAKAFFRFGVLSLANAGPVLLRRLRQGSVSREDGSSFSRARVDFRVALSLLRHLPEMLAKRRQIRRSRRVQDAEIIRWFYSKELWNARCAR
jgi:GT2 family glycosyltransferase